MSDPLATASVEVIAELERFEPDLRAQLLAAVQRAGRDAEKEFDRAGKKSGKRFVDAVGKAAAAAEGEFSRSGSRAGQAFSDGISKGIRNTKAVQDARAQVERLEAAYVSAARRQSTAANELARAERVVAEIRAKGITDTDRVSRAEERLAAARTRSSNLDGIAEAAARRLAGARTAFTKAGDDAGLTFVTRLRARLNQGASGFASTGANAAQKIFGGLSRWIAGNGESVFTQLRENIGGGFLKSLTGALSTPVIGPILLVALIAAAEAVAAPVGAILAGGIVTAFGAGIAALGIVFAAKGVEPVKKAWTSSLQDMAAQLRVLSVPFQQTLINLAGDTRQALAGIAPDLQAAFSRLAPSISNFGGQLSQALQGVGPAIRDISSAFTAVLGVLGPQLQSTIAQIAGSLSQLSSSVAQNPTAIADLVKGVGDLVTVLLSALQVFNDANGAVERLTGGFSLVDGLFAGLQIAIGGILGPLILLAKGIEVVANGLNALKPGNDATAAAVAASAVNFQDLAKGMQATGAAAPGAGAGIASTGAAADTAAAKLQRQTDATNRLIDGLNRLSGLNISVAQANINVQAAVDNATAALKENGRTLNDNTAKGRANHTALLQVAQAANDQRDSLIRNNAGLGAAALAAERSRANFIRLAQQMGVGAGEARKMAADMIAIPNVSRRAILTANITDLQSKLATARASLNDKNLTKTRRAQIEANIAQLERQIRQAKAALASVKDKTVSLTVNYRELLTGKNPPGGIPAGIRAPGREHGGDVRKGHPYVVGEKRAELFVPDQNGTIVPRIPSTAAAGALGAALTAALHGAGGDAIAGLVNGLAAGVPAVGVASAAVAATVIGTVRRRLDMHSPSKVMTQAGQDAVQGLINGIREKLPNLRQVLTSLSTAVPSQVAAAVNKVNTALTGLGKALTSGERTKLNQFIAQARTGIASLDKAGATVSANLKKANDDLVTLLQQAQSFASGVVSTILQTGNITQAQDTSFAGIVKTLSSAVTNARQFQTVLDRLSKAGLNKGLLQQIAEAGPAAGLAVGQSILAAGQAGINQVNKLQTQLQAAANKAATSAATALFGQGIQVARGIVAGLQRQKAQLDATMTKLADVLVARVLRLLRSTKVGSAGTLTIPGFSNGGVATSLSAVAEDGRPELVIPLTKPRRRDQLLEQYFPDWAGSQAAARGGRVREINMPVTVAGLTKEETIQVLRAWLDSTLGPRLGIRTAGGVL